MGGYVPDGCLTRGKAQSRSLASLADLPAAGRATAEAAVLRFTAPGAVDMHLRMTRSAGPAISAQEDTRCELPGSTSRCVRLWSRCLLGRCRRQPAQWELLENIKAKASSPRPLQTD